MKDRRMLWGALAFLMAGVLQAREQPATTPAAATVVAVNLTDGSRIVGTSALDRITLQSEAIKVDLDLSRIRSIEFDLAHEEARVMLVNSDRLSGRLRPEKFELMASFGKVSIPQALVTRLVNRGGKGRPLALEGLVMHYAFEQAVDGKVPDETGRNDPADLRGCKLVADGKAGQGLQLAGSSGAVEFPDKNLPMGASPRSVAVWFKTKSYAHPQVLFAYGQPRSNSEFEVLIYENDRTITLGEYGNRYPKGTGRKNVTDGNWHQLVLVYDGQQKVIGYVDGEPDFTAARIYDTAPKGTGVLLAAAPYNFEGTLDEFMVFNRALTAEEVKDLYAQTE